MREIFELFGTIGLKGLEGVKAGLTGLEAQYDKVEKAIFRMGKAADRLGETLTKNVTIPLVAVGAAVAKSTQLASDLNETISKTGFIFGDYAKEIESWAGGAAKSIGQSKREAMDAAGTFGIFGKAAGLSGKNLVDFSKQFTELSGDLASFFNTSPQEAIVAIGAAFRGESEPIRKYGILLDDLSLRQKAYDMGLTTSTKEVLLPHQKVLASAALIMQQSKAAQGDFARTSNQLANQQRILAAEVKNASMEFGTAFLPIALKLVGIVRLNIIPAIQSAATWFRGLSESTKENVIAIAALLAGVGPLSLGLGKAILAFKEIKSAILLTVTATRALTVAMATNPFGIAIIGATALVGLLFKIKSLEDDRAKKDAEAEAMGAKNKELSGLIQQRAKDIAELNRLGKDAHPTKSMLDEMAILRVEIEDTTKELDKLLHPEKQATPTAQANPTSGNGENEDKGDPRAVEEELKRQRELRWNALKEQQSDKANFNKKMLDAELDKVDEDINAWQKEQGELFNLRARNLEQNGDTIGLLKLQRDEELKHAGGNAEKIYLINKHYDKEILKSRTQTVVSYIQSISNLISQIGAFFQKASENRLQEIENQKTAEEDRIKSSALSEEEKRKKIDALEESSEKKKREIQGEAARRQKAVDFMSSITGTAVAVVGALGQKPWTPLNFVLAGIVGAMGLAQTALIAAQPIPMAIGAFVKKREGGILANIGEGRDDEVVMPIQVGIRALADGIISRISAIAAPRMPVMAAAGGEVHLHIGTLIADERGLKQLERQMAGIRIYEQQRRGYDG